MTNPSLRRRHTALAQQGYDYSPQELRELEWGLRFTPILCMIGALVGLALRAPTLHFALAALGILPFWFPAFHPLDRLYNHVLRPLWNGVPLPPNPLPRRIACFMGGAMNIGIGLSFVLGSVPAAYAFGIVLIALQLVVITTHFCVASWMYEGVLRALGRWIPPISLDRAKSMLTERASLIDVRNPDEYATGHLPGARNVPLDQIEGGLDAPFDQPLILYCKSGLRSQEGVQILRKKGFREAHTLGAMARWEQ